MNPSECNVYPNELKCVQESPREFNVHLDSFGFTSHARMRVPYDSQKNTHYIKFCDEESAVKIHLPHLFVLHPCDPVFYLLQSQVQSAVSQEPELQHPSLQEQFSHPESPQLQPIINNVANNINTFFIIIYSSLL